MDDGTRQFLELLNGPDQAGFVTVPDAVILAVLGGPTFEPATNALDAAIAAGDLALLSDDELRRELATWRRQLADTNEDEREVRDITNRQVVPLLSRDRTNWRAPLPSGASMSRSPPRTCRIC
jgi:hypothetical protein